MSRVGWGSLGSTGHSGIIEREQVPMCDARFNEVKKKANFSVSNEPFKGSLLI